MGWDAYARPMKHIKAFRAAADEVAAAGDGCDGLLGEGGLDCTPCAKEFERITGCSAWSEDGYAPKFVSEKLWPAARDSEPPKEKERMWAWRSTVAFIKVCADKGLGMEFSW